MWKWYSFFSTYINIHLKITEMFFSLIIFADIKSNAWWGCSASCWLRTHTTSLPNACHHLTNVCFIYSVISCKWSLQTKQSLIEAKLKCRTDKSLKPYYISPALRLNWIFNSERVYSPILLAVIIWLTWNKAHWWSRTGLLFSCRQLVKQSPLANVDNSLHMQCLNSTFKNTDKSIKHKI